MTYRRLKFPLLLALSVPFMIGGAACKAGCDKKDCWQPGVYLRLGLTPEADKATICIDGECSTLAADRRPEFTGADQKYALVVSEIIQWNEGREVNVTIDVLDASGTTIAHLAERRAMQAHKDACSPCPSFVYRTEQGSLIRD